MISSEDATICEGVTPVGAALAIAAVSERGWCGIVGEPLSSDVVQGHVGDEVQVWVVGGDESVVLEPERSCNAVQEGSLSGFERLYGEVGPLLTEVLAVLE